MNILSKNFSKELLNIILEYYDDFQDNTLNRLKYNLNKYKHVQIWMNKYTSVGSMQKFKIDSLSKSENFLYMNIILECNINKNLKNYFYIDNLDIITIQNIKIFFEFLFLINRINVSVDVIKLDNNILYLKIFLKNYIVNYFIQHTTGTYIFHKYRLELIRNRISDYDIDCNSVYLQEDEHSINNFRKKISLLYYIFDFPNINYNKIYTLIM
jgi:hypothetical protein